jgi:3-dehydroquinate dehydratase type I
MLCRSIAVEGLDRIMELIKGAEMAEIRIEKTGLNADQIKSLFKSHPNLIATCRPDGLYDEKRTELLKAAIEGGARWIDLEVESAKSFTEPLVEMAKSKNCKVIISYHNYDETPEISDLIKIIDNCSDKNADLVKLATHVNRPMDISNLLILYSYGLPILALGMGALGSITRVAALKMGAPFTFVSCDSEDTTAPGQISESCMKTILNNL